MRCVIVSELGFGDSVSARARVSVQACGSAINDEVWPDSARPEPSGLMSWHDGRVRCLRQQNVFEDLRMTCIH